MHVDAARSPLAPVFLAGPTAAGKSAIALALAEQLGGEIISVDSMQVYRGLDIGTAKPSAAERARVPHHLLDVAELSAAFDAAQFLRLASAAVQQIQGRGRVPIFCGGTGFYFKAWLDGLGDAPPANPRVRAELEAMPLPDLLAELERCDMETFARIDRQNPRRVVRALEVLRITGKPFSAQRADWHARNTQTATPVLCLTREAADLRARIEARVDAMFAAGLVAETQALMRICLATNPTAMQAIGYRQVSEHLHGERGLEETIALVKTKTWQFARRQGTWFRRQLPVLWISLAADAEPVSIAREIVTRRGLDSAPQASASFAP